MVVIGGTALTGGRGTIIGTVLGIFILRVMRNGIVLIGVPGPRLQHLHRRDHPRHDGAALLARTPAPGGDLTTMAEELVRMEHISKFYGRVQALDDVNLHRQRARDRRAARRQRRRQVDADQGPVRRGRRHQRRHLHARPARSTIRSTTDAIAHGIETIYQDSALVTQLSIARNLFLGREPVKGPRFLNRMDQAAMNEVARDLLQAGRHHQGHPADDADRLALRRRAPGGGDRPRHAFRQRPDHPRRADQQSRRRGDAGRAAASCATPATPGIPASSSPTTSTTSSRWSTASSCMRRGKVVADDIDPKHTSIEEVERVITGMSEHDRFRPAARRPIVRIRLAAAEEECPTPESGESRPAYSSGSVVNRSGYPLFRPASVARVALVSAMSLRIDGDDADAAPVRGDHHAVRLVLAHAELRLEHGDHEFARREVVVDENDLVEARPLGLRPDLGA